MNWRSPAARLALLELLVLGSLKRRRAQASAWDTLDELPWTRRTGRRDELGLVEERRHELVALLDRVWTKWGETLAELTARGLAPTPDGWNQLEDALRSDGLPHLPDLINRHTAAAIIAPHSKASLTDRRIAALGDTVATHDGSARLRPPLGLAAVTSKGKIDLTAIASILGEVSIPERALYNDFSFDGTILAALLIENLGAFCDLPPIDGWLYIHVPGWDTTTVTHILGNLTKVPIIHFGDIDPNGAKIFHHLKRIRSDMQWFTPEFWAEFIDGNGLPGTWPDDIDLLGSPHFVQDLKSRGIWLEQEPIVLDPRTRSALTDTANRYRQ